MELSMVIRNCNKENLLSPNNRQSRKLEHHVHDSQLRVNTPYLSRKNLGKTNLTVGCLCWQIKKKKKKNQISNITFAIC